MTNVISAVVVVVVMIITSVVARIIFVSIEMTRGVVWVMPIVGVISPTEVVSRTVMSVMIIPTPARVEPVVIISAVIVIWAIVGVGPPPVITEIDAHSPASRVVIVPIVIGVPRIVVAPTCVATRVETADTGGVIVVVIVVVIIIVVVCDIGIARTICAYVGRGICARIIFSSIRIVVGVTVGIIIQSSFFIVIISYLSIIGR